MVLTESGGRGAQRTAGGAMAERCSETESEVDADQPTGMLGTTFKITTKKKKRLNFDYFAVDRRGNTLVRDVAATVGYCKSRYPCNPGSCTNRTPTIPRSYPGGALQ